MGRRDQALALLATGGALALVVAFGDSWLLDWEVVALVAVVAAVPFVQAPVIESEEAKKEQHPRSRIAHYARISQFRRGSSLLNSADNPFERRALSHERWPSLTDRDLDALAAE